jgi:hypothetical protein
MIPDMSKYVHIKQLMDTNKIITVFHRTVCDLVMAENVKIMQVEA